MAGRFFLPARLFNRCPRRCYLLPGINARWLGFNFNEIAAAIVLQSIFNADISRALFSFVVFVITDKADFREVAVRCLQDVDFGVRQNPMIRRAGIGIPSIASRERCNLLRIGDLAALRSL